ncbi:MAG: amidase [Paracoccaceae bacterium]|nr:amidase [Paracoccaceae bacterium]
MINKKITTSDISGAEKILGINYSKVEREQMVNNLESQILSAKIRRAHTLENSHPMASIFDPRLPGFKMPLGSGVKLKSKCVPIPKNSEDIAFATIGEQSDWIKRGKITSRKLTEIYLDRIERLQDKLKCFVTITKKQALAEADAMDLLTYQEINLGPLHGIPYGLKDLFDTKGIKTGWGAEPYRDRVPDKDAAVVEVLRAAGAVLLGKTTLGALAYNDIWYGGRTKNPWNLNEGSSGSSAGSASATAAGLCSFSIGTETLGSITSPSQRCGTTGLRPTFGRVSRLGSMALCWSLDKVGPICRCVEDTGIVLSVLNSHDKDDRFNIKAPFSFDNSKNIDDLIIGYLPETFKEGASELDRNTLKIAMGLGVRVKEVELEELPYMSLINILYAEAAAAFEDLTLSDVDDTLTWQDNDAWPNTFRKARFLSAVDHVQLDRLRYLVMKALDNLFNEIDILIGPFDTGPMLVASNFTGHPCLHLRVGYEQLATRGATSFNKKNFKLEATGQQKKFKVPHGISLWGGLFEEEKILNFGIALENALDVYKERPSLPINSC